MVVEAAKAAQTLPPATPVQMARREARRQSAAAVAATAETAERVAMPQRQPVALDNRPIRAVAVAVEASAS
jgi:hypothetical protein